MAFENGRIFSCLRCGFPLLIPGSIPFETLSKKAGEGLSLQAQHFDHVILFFGQGLVPPVECPRCKGHCFQELEHKGPLHAS